MEHRNTHKATCLQNMVIWMHTANENLTIHVTHHQHKSTGQWEPGAEKINLSAHSEGTNTRPVKKLNVETELKPNQTRGFTHTAHLKNKSAPGLRTREAASEPYEGPRTEVTEPWRQIQDRNTPPWNTKARQTKTDKHRLEEKGLEEGKKHTQHNPEHKDGPESIRRTRGLVYTL